MSHLEEYLDLFRIYGLIYNGVPTRELIIVSRFWSICFAKPKSVILNWESCIRILAGFISRCMMPCFNKALIPNNKSFKILSASASGMTLIILEIVLSGFYKFSQISSITKFSYDISIISTL